MLSLRRILPAHHHPFSTSISAAISANTTTTPSLPQSYKVQPPIKPWPHRLNPKLLSSLISRQHDPNLSLQIFLHAQHHHRPPFSHNPQTYQAILLKLSRFRCFREIETLLTTLRGSPQQFVNYCGEEPLITVIRGYGLAGKPLRALKTFMRIESFGIRSSVRSLNASLNSLVQNKRYRLAFLLFKNYRDRFGVLPNVVSCNVLLKALCKGNEVEVAVRVLDEMPGMGLVPNVVSYTTVLGGYAWRGDMDGAMTVFREILDRGWDPDVTSYTVLVDGFCRLGKLLDAIRVMDVMEENGVEPNEVTYGVMIQAYCKEKRSGEAVNLIEDMLGKDCVPGSELCCNVVDLLCEEGNVERACEGKVLEARNVFDEFGKGSVASLLTYNTLIAGLCEGGKLCEAAKLWDDMVEKGVAANAFTYNMLIKGFCKDGNAKEGIRILEEMLENGCLPNKSTYLILIDGLLLSGGMQQEINKVVSLAMSTGVDDDLWNHFVRPIVGNVDCGAAELDKILLENAV
ncbi:unnamed protein product [Vicia faba]|uniref:Pentatricopeptide repeat-containing protein n=1 Tax=Vicia faba TaxID=3906 RepID=A0AAV1AUE9_VICFA|nr:unnamed protein product [Vicia faba]